MAEIVQGRRHLPRRAARRRLPHPPLGRGRGRTRVVRDAVPAQDRARRPVGLLVTVVLLFALQGERITNEPLDVARIALPLVAYFALMWTGALWLARRVGLGDHRATTVAFMAAGNNFELAIAVAISVFGVTGRYGEPGTTFLCRDLRPSGLKVRSICRLSWVMSDHALVGRARAKVWVAGSSPVVRCRPLVCDQGLSRSLTRNDAGLAPLRRPGVTRTPGSSVPCRRGSCPESCPARWASARAPGSVSGGAPSPLACPSRARRRACRGIGSSASGGSRPPRPGPRRQRR